MKSILQGLYTGAIIPWERRNPPDTRQRKLLRKIEDEEHYFTAKMSLDDRRRFEVLSNLYSDLSAIGEERLFSYAFSLGLLLALEVVSESQTLYNNSKNGRPAQEGGPPV